MTIVRVKGFKIFHDRHGKLRCYDRATGEPIDLAKAPLGSAAFLSECARIAGLAASKQPSPGSLGKLTEAYRASPAFLDLAELTRSDYQRVFNYLQPIAATPLARFTRPLIVRIRDKAVAAGSKTFAANAACQRRIVPGQTASVRRYLRPLRPTCVPHFR
jgi:hypothetical protein